MNATHASYILNAYSFIHTCSDEHILKTGYQTIDGSPIPSFDEELLIKLCEDAQKIFEKEENVIEIEGDAIIVGDIHGSFHDLLRILHYIEASKSKVIFLGDYVDRGNFSLECITLLFALKIMNPESYFLLRGNHEFDTMCSEYGFKKEILNYHNPKKINMIKRKEISLNLNEINFDLEEEEDKEEEDSVSNEVLCDNYYANHVNINCYKYSEKLYDAFMSAFSYLPISAIVNKTSICLHGGLTPLLDKVDTINRSIQRPINNFDDNELLCDIEWGDPAPNLTHFYGNSQRGRGKLFNGAAVVNFLKNNNLKRIIRGHECVFDGTLELFNDKCITVFSASSYASDMGNCSGILKIYQKEDIIEHVNFPPLHRLNKYDANYFKVQAFYQSQTQKSMLKYKSCFLSTHYTLNASHADQCHMNKPVSLDESKNLSQTNMSNGLLLFNFPAGTRKSKVVLNRRPLLRSGPRKKKFSSNVCLINKNPIMAPVKISQYKSQIIYS